MDLAGNGMHTLDTDDKGAPLLSRPSYISVDESGEVLYISEWRIDKVTKVSMTGKLISTHKTKNWDGLLGLICVGQDQLLVSNCSGRSVDVVSEDCKTVGTLLDTTHGIQSPCALCYCASQEIMYVSSNWDGKPKSLSVFKVANK